MRRLVNVAASTSPGARAKRHSNELAAKHSIAAAVSIKVRSDVPVVGAGAGLRCMINRHAVAALAIQRWWMCSAILAASSPTPDKNEEFILDNQGRPRK